MTDNNCDTSLQHITHIRLSYVLPGRITKQALVKHATMDQTGDSSNPKRCHLRCTHLLQLGDGINVLLRYTLMRLDPYSNATTVTEMVAKVLLQKPWSIYWCYFQ